MRGSVYIYIHIHVHVNTHRYIHMRRKELPGSVKPYAEQSCFRSALLFVFPLSLRGGQLTLTGQSLESEPSIWTSKFWHLCVRTYRNRYNRTAFTRGNIASPAPDARFGDGPQPGAEEARKGTKHWSG